MPIGNGEGDRYRAGGARDPYVAVLLIAVSSFFTLIHLSRKEGFEDRRERVSSEEEHPSEPIPDRELWDAPFSFGLHTCIKPTARYKGARESDRYITVRSNGGLNQMRTGIADMVAVAHIMNATLVIPQLDRRSFWKDTSTFSDIFDETHFIEALKGDIRVATELRKELESVPHARKHFSSWASMGYFKELTRLWNEYQICISHAIFLMKSIQFWVIHVAKSDSRPPNNDLPLDIQRLRCRAMYNALRFSPPIEILAKKLMERLRSRDGRYVALHLRYEKNMLSFTGCTYGLTEAESKELTIMRENTIHWKVNKINSTEQRLGGNCPLTAKEVGIFLRALGYPPATLIYIAAGEIYGGNARLSTLSWRFPNLVFKETLGTKEELEGLSLISRPASPLFFLLFFLKYSNFNYFIFKFFFLFFFLSFLFLFSFFPGQLPAIRKHKPLARLENSKL
ncbi:O-fucosyltransferase 38-like [Eucalyptus grandis]|uniref:O-fucosyltransferase 38-like n=1 Tax=Eucalyptus grandis TaxID=71139 RepID=UPI00192EB395|nr:O-fucosyltransferase 38-like [Eucalyptus grandis]